MQVLCLDIPQANATSEQYAPYLRDEVRHGWNLYKSGFIRQIHFRQDRPGVVLIAEADSVDAARATLMEFPLAKVDLIGWEIIPLGPMVNWEILFAAP